MRKIFIVLLVITWMATAIAPISAQDETIMEIATGNPDLSTLAAAMTATDPAIAEALSGEGEFTIFAPTNDAFAKLLEELGLTAEELLADSETLNAVLRYHVIEGVAMSADIVSMLEESDAIYPEALSGIRMKVALDGGSIKINDVATVVTADIKASNGVIHIVDTVLTPPGTIADVVAKSAGDEETPQFTTFLAAMQAAGLVETLSDPEAEFTIFAPTDEAFAAALEALGMSAEDFLADTEKLTSILLYHVVPDEVYSGDMVAMLVATPDGVDVTTVNGATAKVTAGEDGGVKINEANLIGVDIIASNGVIHVIDAVILLPAE
jgi:uncharacterized surface protein with fasciclin (FAS1) repeats